MFWGFSFKPETDDVRESPAIHITKKMLSKGANVRAFDPAAMAAAQKILPNIQYCPNAYDVCKGSNALVIFTEWNEFRRLDLLRIKSLLRKPVMIDCRNIYEPAEVTALGFKYHGVGRAERTLIERGER